MVYPQYVGYETMYYYRMINHALRYRFPLDKNKPFILKWKIYGPLFELIMKFINHEYDKIQYRISLLHNHGIFESLKIDESPKQYVSECAEIVIATHQIPKNKLYELTNYIIANYEPDYQYENNMYLIKERIQPIVNGWCKLLAIPFQEIKENIQLVKYIICRIINQTGIIYNALLNFDSCMIKINNIKDLQNLIALSIACIMVNGCVVDFNCFNNPQHIYHDITHISPIYHQLYHTTIDTSDMEEAYKYILQEDYNANITTMSRCNYTNQIYTRQYTNPDRILLEKYDSNYDLRPILSLYSAFINVLENLESRTIHKYIYNGIVKQDIKVAYGSCIIPITKNMNGKKDYFTVSYTVTNSDEAPAIILLYYISENIDIPAIYNLKWDSYIRACTKILNDNKEYWNIMNKEYNFIKKYFDYGEMEQVIENIIIDIKFSKININNTECNDTFDINDLMNMMN